MAGYRKNIGNLAKEIALFSVVLLLSGVSTAWADDIVLAPGDEVQVFIPGAEQAEQNYQIDIQGEISLGIYGKAALAGLTIRQANDRLRTHLKKYLKSVSGISILLRQRGRIVLITGCVTTPGVIRIEPTDDLWQAIHRAGGLSACADLSKVALVRRGEETTVDLKSYLTRDSKTPLPEIMTGDTLLVPSGPGLSASEIAAPFLGHEAIRNRVFVLGAVATPGAYNRTQKMDVLTMVAAANGPIGTSDLSHAVVLTKDGSVTVDLQKELSGEIREKHMLPDDSGAIVYIPFLQENIDTRLGDHINVLGGFGRQGRIPVSGPIKLIDAIALAGGLAERAKSRRLRVIEEGPGYTLSKLYNLKKYMKRGGAAGRVMVNPGSTIVIGQVNLEAFNTTMSTLSAIGMISSSLALWLTATGTLGAGE